VAIFLSVLQLAGVAGIAQDRKPFSLNDISDLVKNVVSPNRIAKLVEDRGIGFEADERALRRLSQVGANETVLSAIKRMSGQYTEEKQRLKAEAAAKANAEREIRQKEAAAKAERDRQQQEAKAKLQRDKQEAALKERELKLEQEQKKLEQKQRELEEKKKNEPVIGPPPFM
jgi:hypothetical protein